MPTVPAPLLSIEGTWRALRVPTLDDWLLTSKAAAAVGLSLLIGFSQNLENPYWSALTVYVLIAPPQAGAVRSKSWFRLTGTLLGGALSIVLGALFASSVGTLLVASIVTILIAYYAKVLDRTPTSYTWFVAALTIDVVVITQVRAPETIFLFATTRVLEISLAIVLFGLLDSVVLPRSATPGFMRAMTDWRDRAADWLAAALAENAAPDARERRRRELHSLAGLLGPLDAAGVQLPYDIVAVPPRRRDLRFLRLTVVELIAGLAATDAWCEHTDGGTEAAGFRAWLSERPNFADPAILDHAACGDLLRGRLTASLPDEPDVLRLNTRLHLSELLEHWTRFERTLHAVATGSSLPPPLRALAKLARPARSTDFVLGLLDIAPLALAMGGIAGFWYATAWTSGINALLFVYIALGFILGTPGAMRSAKGICLWIAIACALTLVFQFAVLPRVTAFPVLIAVLLAGLIPLGLLAAMSPAGVLILANGFAFLGLQSAYAADFEATLENLFGSLAACLVGVTALYICRFDRAHFSARRLARALRRDLVDTARSRRLPDRDRTLSLSVDRIVLFFGIVDGLRPDDPLHREHPFATLRLADNLLRLRIAARSLGAAAQASIGNLREAIADRDRAAQLTDIDATLQAVLAESTGGDRAEALAALTGLRIALLADTPSGAAE